MASLEESMNNEFDDIYEEDYIEHTRKTIKGRKEVFSFLPTVIMVLLLFAVSSISSLLQFSFSLKDVAWTSLCLTLGLRLTMLIASQWIGADCKFRADQKNEDLDKARKEYRKASEELDIAAFDRWVYMENIHRKTEAYRNKNNKKIADIDIKISRIKRKLLFSPSEALEISLQKLEHKKEDIEAINTDEFIRQHILDVKVKYNALHVSDFLTPSEFLSGKDEKYHMSEAVENVSEIAKFIPTTIFITILFSLVGTSYHFGTLSVVSLIFDVFSTAFNFSTGWFYVGRRTVATQIFVFRSRKAVIDRHLSEIAKKETKKTEELEQEEEKSEEKTE